MNIETGIFSWPLARELATFAALAYTKASVQDSRTNAQAFVTVNSDGDIVVAFKGSSSPRDFLQDAKFMMRQSGWAVNDSPAMAHAGFLEDFTAIEAAVIGQVEAYLAANHGAKIYVTGHSLGGALAILGALELHRQKLPVGGVYTFGQPRVGNKGFTDIYDAKLIGLDRVSPHQESLWDRTFRVVNQNDIVPRLPGWLDGYRHCGQEIFLPVGGGWWLNPSWPLKCLSDLIGLYGAYRNREEVLVREHFLQAYCRAMATQRDFTGRTASTGNPSQTLNPEMNPKPQLLNPKI
jgi:pimeloyl-ACP methyl ester carboxylesterase